MNPSRALGVLAKWPIEGRVKTRLTPPLEPTQAMRLYRALVADLLTTLDTVQCQSILFLDQSPGPAVSLGWPAWPVEIQPEGDLGARLLAAATRLLDHARSAILVGSDHPDLPASLIERAFTALEQADIVIGPALDGGYYLIGMGTAHAELFSDMPWSTSALLAATLDRTRRLGLRVAALPPWYDVDTVADLRCLARHLELLQATGDRRGSHTRLVLEELIQRGVFSPADAGA